MSARLWLPVAVLGLAGGAVVATLINRMSIDNPDTGDDGAGQSTSTDLPEGTSGYALEDQGLSEIDRALPAFSLAALDDTVWTPESLKGKPWVINFWATWCPPCIEEIPSMNAAFEILEPQGIGMLAINAGEGAIAVEAFLQRIDIEFPNVLGDETTLTAWSVRGLPTTIVVDAEGRVVYEALGPRKWDDEELLQQVVDLL